MPQLTSLIDMMTILLVFLLKSFSAEGNLITPSSDLALPVSTSAKMPAPALMIEVTRGNILVDGHVVASMEDVRRTKGLIVAPLYGWLQRLASAMGGEGKAREVMIQCDKDCDFRYMKRVMATCAKASFSDFSLLVLRPGQI